MRGFLGLIRRASLHWQVKNLEVQARNIVHAREQAMVRLLQIQLDKEIKERELIHHNAAALRHLRLH